MQSGRDSDSGATPVRREEGAELAAQVAGPVFLPGDDGYAAECVVYNLNLVPEPALIVGVTSEADVQAAVRFAAQRGLPVAVNNTGHHVARAAHGALLISTQRMSGVTIDSENRTARIEPGVRWGQVINEASEVGLAPMNGSTPTVGSIGYSLGGGQSVAWSRSKGYAADHIHSLDVVAADGVLRHVTADSEPELFWALRGGMGNFGVVTAMVCELFAQTRIYGGGVWFAIEHVPELLPAWREWAETLPEEATTSVAVQRLPPLPDLPPPLQGASVLHMRFTHLGSAAEGERLFAPMRAIAPSILDTVAEMPYTSIGTVHMDPPEPIPYWDRTMMFDDLPKEGVDEFVALTGPDSDCPLISVEIRHLGGAMDREPAVPNAVPTRGLPFVLFCGRTRRQSLSPSRADPASGWPVVRCRGAARQRHVPRSRRPRPRARVALASRGSLWSASCPGSLLRRRHQAETLESINSGKSVAGSPPPCEALQDRTASRLGASDLDNAFAGSQATTRRWRRVTVVRRLHLPFRAEHGDLQRFR